MYKSISALNLIGPEEFWMIPFDGKSKLLVVLKHLPFLHLIPD